MPLPQSLLMWLMGEIDDDTVFAAEPEPSSINAPFGIDGSWDGFDNYLLVAGGYSFLFAENPGLRQELDDLFPRMKRQPPWD